MLIWGRVAWYIVYESMVYGIEYMACKQEDPTFWPYGPRPGGFQKSWFANFFMLILIFYVIYHILYTKDHILYIPYTTYHMKLMRSFGPLTKSGKGRNCWNGDYAKNDRRGASNSYQYHGLIFLHSSKLTWKWRGALNKITILYIGPFMSFHVNLGEGNIALCHTLQNAAGHDLGLSIYAPGKPSSPKQQATISQSSP